MANVYQSQYSKIAIRALNADTASYFSGSVAAAIEILDDGSSLTPSVSSIDFVGAGVTATNAGSAVTVTIPGGGSTDTSSLLTTASATGNTITFTKGDGSTFPVTVAGGTGAPGGSDTQLQFNSASVFSGSGNLRFDYVNNTIFLTGSISASSGANTVGFYGTASWAQSASQAVSSSYALTASYASTADIVANPYPINITGSTLYSVAPGSILTSAGGVLPSATINGKNIIFGESASSQAISTNANSYNNSVILGTNAGYNQNYSSRTQTGTVIIGADAGGNNIDNNKSIYIGANAGNSAFLATESIAIGYSAGASNERGFKSINIGSSTGVYAAYNPIDFTDVAKIGNYSINIGNQTGVWFYDAFNGGGVGPRKNNTIIGNSISLPDNTSNYVNLGGAFFISGAYYNETVYNYYDSATYSSILTGSVNNAKVGINLWNPSYSLHVSGTVAFPNLTTQSQANVVLIDTASGQLFYTASSAIGGGGSGTPGGQNTSIQFNDSSTFSGSGNFTFNKTTSTVNLIGSISASSGANTVGFFGTASWAQSASQAISSSYTISSSYAQTASYATNLIVSGGLTQLDYIDFDTASAALMQAARLKWDNGEGTLQLGLGGGNVDLNVGEQLYQYVYNAQGAPLTKGQIVYVSSSQGGRIAVKLASATAEQGSANTLGFVAETIDTDLEGWVMTEGSLRGVNTDGFTPGGLIYLSSSAGQYTQTPQQAPLHGVRLGYAQKIDNSTGIIYVKIDNGYELDELHDVRIVSDTNGDLLVRSSSLWINSKQLTGSYGLTGSLTATSFTGSLFGTASYVTGSIFTISNPALTASYAEYAKKAGTADTASFLDVATYNITASWANNAVRAITASYVTGSVFTSTNPALTASYALTASFWGGYLSTSSLIGNGSTTTFNINHGFNTLNIHVTVYSASGTYENVYPDIRRINANTASIVFANPPTSNQYIVYISQ